MQEKLIRHIVNVKNKVLDIVIPLHWIISDQTGKSMILEYTNTGMHLVDNPVGVMTNSPSFSWHLNNLGNYGQLQPTETPDRQYGAYVTKSNGPGYGGSWVTR